MECVGLIKMKINDLMNENNQLNELIGWFKKDPVQQNINRYLPGFMKRFKEYIAYSAKTGSNPNDPALRSNVLQQMIKYYTKPTRNELITINKQIQNSIQDLNDNAIEKIASYAIALELQKKILPQQQKAKKKNIKQTSPSQVTGQVPVSITSGTAEKAGGVEYVWNGNEWRNGTNGQPATSAIAAALTAKVTGAMP